MSKRNLFFLLFVALVFIIATGIPIKSNPSLTELVAGRNVNMTSCKDWPDLEGDVYLQRQNEPSLAVSTANPLHLLAGANDYRSVDSWESEGNLPGIPEEAVAGDAWLGVFTSSDGGQSWKSKLLPGYFDNSVEVGDSLKPYEAASDPTVRAGIDGLFFYSGISFDRIRNGPSVIFVCRYKDYNDTEIGDSIRYIDTTIIDEGTSGQFADKPWMAVDIPRSGYPDGVVYLVYSTFLGDITKTIHNKIMFARSIDGGNTWETPIKLSEGNRINQGTTVAIDPQNGDVYVAWRRFAAGNDPNAIMVAKSTDHGQTFTKAIEAAIINFPFDQPTYDLVLGTIQFRTNAFPTIAVDNNNTVYLAWTQREYENGPARIYFTSSTNGIDWPPATRIHNQSTAPDDYNAEGHMFMPSMTFAAGKLLIAWYDSRFSVRLQKNNLVTGKWITDSFLDDCPVAEDHPCHWRETIDIRIAQAEPGASSFEPSTQVSRYLWGLERDVNGELKRDGEGYPIPVQLQYNAPNLPLFKGGTVPFIGDYIDLVPAPMFIYDEGSWRFNTGETLSESNLSLDPFVFYVSWADNRDVRCPPDDPNDNINPWTWYVPPEHGNCTFGFNAGMRDQNIYVSRITSGISIGCPGNYKPSGEGQKAFVVNVENMTGYDKAFNLNILNPPDSPGTASFLPNGIQSSLIIDVPRYSSISRHVFIESFSPHATLIEVSELGVGDFVGYVYLYSVSEGGSTGESISLNILDGGVISWSNPPEGAPPPPNANLINPTMFNPTMFNPTMFNPTMFNPTMFNPTMFNPTMFNPTMFNANIFNPTMFNPTMFNANIFNPTMFNPTMFNRPIDSAEIVDKFWKVTNTGDTASSYTLKTIAGDLLPSGYYNQLLVYKIHRTPATDGETCNLIQDENHELLINIANPEVHPDISSYKKIVDPELANADFTNATFSLAPGEEAIVLLRVIDTSNLYSGPSSSGFVGFGDFGSFIGFGSLGGSLGTSNGNSPDSSPEEYVDNVGAVVISHSSTEEFEITAITLMVLPYSLPNGTEGIGYSFALKAIGGTPSYSWDFYGGSLPLGVEVTSNGTISGCPEQAGNFNFTVQVTDGEGQTDTQKFTLTIVGPPPITVGLDQSTVPFGMKGSDYSGNLSFTAEGGIRPYTSWNLNAVNKWTLEPVDLGLTLTISGNDGEKAAITGAPALAGEFTVTVEVFDSSCPEPKSGTLPIDLCFSPEPLSIAITPPLKTTDPPALIDGTLGDEYNVEFLVENYESFLVWDITGLPPGLSIGTSGSMKEIMNITGIPVYDETKNYPASYNIEISVTDNFPNCDTSVPREIIRNFTITIHLKQPKWAVEGVGGEATAAVTDSSGNVYVTGYTFGEGTGKDYYTAKYDGDGNFEWGVQYNGPGNGEDVPSAIAVDSSGVYVTGTSLGNPTGEGQDIYTVKYDITDGHIIWENRYDGPSHMGDGGNDLALDNAGNPHGAGFVHRGNVKKHADYTTIKYSASGEIIWDEQYDSTRNGNDVATAIAVDSSGNVYVTGKSQESLPKDATTHDFLTLKYNSSGRMEWEARDDGPGLGDDEATAIALHEVSPDEVYVYVTGYTTGGTAIKKDYYTVKYDANGTNLWPGGRTYNGPGNEDDIATSIAVDKSSGDVYVIGKSSGTNGYDYATIKYSSSGALSWAKRYDGGIGNDEAVSIAVDGADIYVAGFITKEEDGTAKDKDFYIIKYDTAGNTIWIAQYDGPSQMDDVATAMTVNSGIYVVGYSKKESTPTVFAVVKFEK